MSLNLPQTEVDTRTYFSSYEDLGGFCSRCGAGCSCFVLGSGGEPIPSPSTPRAVTSEVVVVGHGGQGHGGFPCPPTRGQTDCSGAWDRFRIHSPLTLYPAR